MYLGLYSITGCLPVNGQPMRFDTKRPPIASQMVKRGLLESIDIPEDQRVKFGGLMKIYRLSRLACRENGHLQPYHGGMPDMTKVAQMLRVQDFILQMVNPDPLSDDWMTQRECKAEHSRRRFVTNEFDQTPMPNAIILRDNREIWIEREFSPKNGPRRDLMVTQYETLFRESGGIGLFGLPIDRVLVIAPNARILKSYEKSFDAESMQPVERHRHDHGYSRNETAEPIHPKATFNGRVVLTCFDRKTGACPGLEPGFI